MLTYKEILSNKNSVCLSCIYILINENKVVYIGQSKNGGFDRIGSHFKYSDKKFDSYFIHKCLDSEINELEAEYILNFSPHYNKSIPSNDKYKSIQYISKLYKIWNIKKFISKLKASGIKIYKNNYVEVSKTEQFARGL